MFKEFCQDRKKKTLLNLISLCFSKIDIKHLIMFLSILYKSTKNMNKSVCTPIYINQQRGRMKMSSNIAPLTDLKLISEENCKNVLNYV